MTTEDRLTSLEVNHKGMQDRLDKMEKDLKDEIAQAQRNTVSQIMAMLRFREPESGKTIEAVDVLSLQPEMNCETFPPKGRFQIHMAGTSAHVPAESRMNHGKNQGREVLNFNEATYKVSVNKKLEDRFDKLEEIIGAMQGGNIYGGVDARDLSLVNDMYARMWRDMASQVQPPLLKSEVTPMFVETLTGPFYDHMLNHATKDFADMVLNGEFILEAIRSGRLKEEEYDEH
ncbi:hypothetical protein GQ457_05G013470 [Hibiscus cannabinus]